MQAIGTAEATTGEKPVVTPAELEGITATLTALCEQIRRGCGELQGLRERAGEQLYKVRSAFEDGAYGRVLDRLSIHRKTAARWIGDYCKTHQMPLPGSMARRSASSLAAAPNTHRQNGDTVSPADEPASASDAGGFYVADATPEQLAAMRAADGVDADGELADDFECEPGNDMDPEDDGEDDTEQTAQSTDEPSCGGMDNVSGPLSTWFNQDRNSDAVRTKMAASPVVMEPGVLKPSGDLLEMVQLPKPIRLPPVTGDQMRLDDLYAAAETAQGRLREIKAALTMQLDEHQRAAVTRAYEAIEAAHAALAIGGAR